MRAGKGATKVGAFFHLRVQSPADVRMGPAAAQ